MTPLTGPDWEHNAIRFNNGVPQSVWYSQHSNGMAYTYSAVEKQGLRVSSIPDITELYLILLANLLLGKWHSRQLCHARH